MKLFKTLKVYVVFLVIVMSLVLSPLAIVINTVVISQEIFHLFTPQEVDGKIILWAFVKMISCILGLWAIYSLMTSGMIAQTHKQWRKQQ